MGLLETTSTFSFPHSCVEEIASFDEFDLVYQRMCRVVVIFVYSASFLS